MWIYRCFFKRPNNFRIHIRGKKYDASGYMQNEIGSHPKVSNGIDEDVAIAKINENESNSFRHTSLLSTSAISKSIEGALSECIPHSTISISQRKPHLAKKHLDIPVDAEVRAQKDSIKQLKTDKRFNEVDIQMLSQSLFQQLNGKEQKFEGPTEEQIELSRKELKRHNLLTGETFSTDDVKFTLPHLEGENIEEHFHVIGEQQCEPYKMLFETLLSPIPKKPKEWVFQTGWTKYSQECQPEAVPFPDEDALVFDVEVCLSAGEMPALATAVSPKAWYSWVSEAVYSGSNTNLGGQYSTKYLIPLETTSAHRGYGHGLKKAKIIVGHNVSYDRSRIKEQYWLEETGTRFIDTMSLHVCISGVTSFQRALLKSSTAKEKTDSLDENQEWRNYSSLNSLSEVHNLYCKHRLDKTTRDIFVTGTLLDIKKDFQNAVKYCAVDVEATYNVFQKLWPMFLSRFPHPVTLAGMLELSTAYLPVNSNWNRYLMDTQQTYEDLDSEARFLLARRADNACKMLLEEKYHEDLWMWDQDWSVQELKLKKSSSKANQNRKRKETEENIISKSEEHKDHIKSNNFANIHESFSEDKATQAIARNDATIPDADENDHDPLSDKFQYLIKTRDFLPAKMPHLPGYPAWYRKLCPRPNEEDWVPGPQLVSTSMQITPKLLCLTWESYPLHYIRGYGWGFLVPFTHSKPEVTGEGPQVPLQQLIDHCISINKDQLKVACTDNEVLAHNLHQAVEANVSTKAFRHKRPGIDTPHWYSGTGVWCNVDIGGCCWFLKLPHKDGNSHRVGNPLAKDFLNKFSENVLAGADAGAERVLAIGRMLSYWRNNKERIEQQLVVWLPKRDLPRSMKVNDTEYGAILPKIVVCGTLTRRAVEPTWMTASNAHKERVGSELRAMVQAPPGYSIVGADVDSQELWIASIIGDSYFAKIHGATPFGWMTLKGKKADGTDMHSVTAKAVGISRDHAKVINYARIYGAGQSFAERLLKQFNPTMSSNEAKSKAAKMFVLTKGKRKYRLKESYRTVLEDRLYSATEALRLRKHHGVNMEEMFEHPRWIGGTESAMFNRLEEIASSPAPVTPFLNGRLSRALEPISGEDDRYLPTRVNWVVQSGAVDFLHLMLVSMRWLLDSKARFCLSFHDEVRYLVPDKYKYQAALSMHITNLLVRFFCAHRLGLHDLPQSVAFFSSVEVDKVLRKEAHQDCCTPSNPHGLSKGYGIPLGESLDIYQALSKAGGSLKIFNKRRKRFIKYMLELPSAVQPDTIVAKNKSMSKATKRKHVIKEMLSDDLELPTDKQEIVRVVASRGNNLHEVEGASGSQFLVSMPTKFRRNVWIKRGDFVLVESIPEGDKVKAEIVKILLPEHVKFLKSNNQWPHQFESNKDKNPGDELPKNTNRPQYTSITSSSSSSDTD